jgi:hypothetical protein
MTDRATPSLAALAEALAAAPPRGFEDLFIERLHEVWWDLSASGASAGGSMQRTGAAVRRDGTLRSADGLDRLGLADLLGIPPRRVPPLEIPASPSPPPFDALTAALPAAVRRVRWRWRWAAVVLPGRSATVRTPELLEATCQDGQRYLSPWPAPPEFCLEGLPPGEGARPHPGPALVLLAPGPASTLLHEMVGHPLEADVAAAGASLWRRRRGDRLLSLPLCVADDPTDLHLPGAFSADDEGVAASRRELLRDGTLVGLLADRPAAATLGIAAGNARRSSVHARPRPRMSNLVGSAPAGESVDALRRGARIEVSSASAASFDPASGVLHLEARRATALPRHGEPRPLPPFCLRGVFEEICAGLLACSSVTEPSYTPGWCGKDGGAVGGRAPWLLIRGLAVL